MLEEGGPESILPEIKHSLNKPDTDGLTKLQKTFGAEWRLDHLLLEAESDAPTPPALNPYPSPASPEVPSDQMKLTLLAVQMRALCELMIEILGVDKPGKTGVNCGQQ